MPKIAEIHRLLGGARLFRPTHCSSGLQGAVKFGYFWLCWRLRIQQGSSFGREVRSWPFGVKVLSNIWSLGRFERFFRVYLAVYGHFVRLLNGESITSLRVVYSCLVCFNSAILDMR